jgi:hypothetical protein
MTRRQQIDAKLMPWGWRRWCRQPYESALFAERFGEVSDGIRTRDRLDHNREAMARRTAFVSAGSSSGLVIAPTQVRQPRPA